MSDLLQQQVHCKRHLEPAGSPIRMILEPRDKDLGGFTVRRLLPTPELRSIGPFIFFDHLGPVNFPPHKGIDVRPHPHIGLATITYVFEGEILHRDSLGNVQSIRPAEINWMTAGKGIAHSERTPPEVRQHEHRLHALQLWIALPEKEEQAEPFFIHYGSKSLPQVTKGGPSIRVLIGEAFGETSAVRTHSPTLFVEVNLKRGETIPVPEHVEELAAYVVAGSVSAQRHNVPLHTLALFAQTAGVELTALEDSTLVFIGGTSLGKRTLWWNLVATRRELIETAKQAWKDRTFPQVPGETEYIPLPR